MSIDGRNFAEASLKTSTYSQYRSLWVRFERLAAERGMIPLPIAAEDFEQILGAFAASSKSASSAQKMVAAVNFFHRAHGFEPPAARARGRLILRGIKRTFAKPTKRAPPLTGLIVKRAIYYQIGSDLYKEWGFGVPLLTWRSVAQIVLSFSALARFHCLTNVAVKDVVFLEGGAKITFWNTKTDTFNQGQPVFLSVLGNSPYCPVRFLQTYIRRLQWEAFLGGSFPYNGPLFPALLGASPSLAANPRPFSKQGALLGLKRHLFHLDVPNWDEFTLHSGRRGGATQAAAAGCSLLSIKRQGRWVSDECLQMYIDEAATMRSDFSSFLGLA